MMASNYWSSPRKQLLEVKSYCIDTAQVLGQGAFGIVYLGTDGKKNTIAAKRIDGKEHPRILTQDLNRFLQLDHPNVMKILDIEKTENILWMMMPLCEFDLNKLYKTRDVPLDANIKIMKQITAGMKYLHSKDIVHRDVKPGNILVAFENPLVIQLTDFDVSKCLDPEVETSLMTTNVGTLAFKAPEFFQRTSPGKIEYHRNVDIYAAGLTFLAILQAEKGKKMLIPQIETPLDDTEFHAPSIGQLIAERVKYKVPILNIVNIEPAKINKKMEQKEEIKIMLKLLISHMTSVNPEKRLSAEQILDKLETAEAYMKFKVG